MPASHEFPLHAQSTQRLFWSTTHCGYILSSELQSVPRVEQWSNGCSENGPAGIVYVRKNQQYFPLTPKLISINTSVLHLQTGGLIWGPWLNFFDKQQNLFNQTPALPWGPWRKRLPSQDTIKLQRHACWQQIFCCLKSVYSTFQYLCPLLPSSMENLSWHRVSSNHVSRCQEVYVCHSPFWTLHKMLLHKWLIL